MTTQRRDSIQPDAKPSQPDRSKMFEIPCAKAAGQTDLERSVSHESAKPMETQLNRRHAE
jgi:hypothetical protein